MMLKDMVMTKLFNYKYILTLFFSIGCILTIHAQQIYSTGQKWALEEATYRGNYFLTDMAIETADHVLLYQLADGGWPKDIYYPAHLSEAELQRIPEAKKSMNSCLKGKSTLAEIHFLSNMFQSSARKKYKKAVEDGISFLLHAQFDNGGWPPQIGDVQPIISFADNSFIDIMNLMWRISEGRIPYDFVSPNLKKQCRESFEAGIDFILRTQCVQNGKPTVWCTIYDAKSLLPIAGDGQDLLALNSQVSDDLATLLMGLSQPSETIIQSIEGAISWYKDNKISGFKRENYVNKQGKRDFRYIEDRHAPDMWALYYDVETNKPLFCESDGEQKGTLDELTYDGRKSLSWYNNDGGKLFRNYEKWKNRQ